MGRSPCCEKMGLKKGPWTPEEDQILINFIRLHGHPNWRALPKQAGLLRCGKSCRLRWTNYLRPDIKRGNFTPDEEDAIIQLHQQLGNRWSAIAARLPGRTDNEIKNVWHTHLKKRLPQANQSPTDQSTTRKRARKQKPSKKGSVSEASKIDHVNSMQQEDENKGNNNGHEDSNVTGNIHASNSVPTNPDIMTSQPLSPQTCTSSSEISTVTSSSEAYNYDNNGSKEIMIDEGDYFGDLLHMDNDFWTDVLPCIDGDTTILTQGDRPMANVYEPCYFDGSLDTAVSTQDYHLGANVSEPYYSNGPLEYSTTEPQCLELMNSAPEAYQEDMDFFWYHLLIKSNDLTELAQVL